MLPNASNDTERRTRTRARRHAEWLALLGVAAVAAGCSPTSNGGFFQMQLDCKPVDLTYKAYLYDLDGFCATAEDVTKIHAQTYPVEINGKVVVVAAAAACHIEVGDWNILNRDPESAKVASITPSILGGSLSGPTSYWKRYVDIRRKAELEPLLRARIERCVSKGFDAIEPEGLDAYSQAGGGFSPPLTADDQIVFNGWFADMVHTYTSLAGRPMRVIQSGDPGQTAALVAKFDGLLLSQCVASNNCDAAQPYLAAGKPVVNIEYDDYPSLTTTGGTDGFCAQLVAKNISGQIKQRALPRSRTACGQLPGTDPQRVGDPVRGRELLLNNGLPGASYLSCGIPKTIWDPLSILMLGQPKMTGRNAQNKDLPYFLSYGTSPAGTPIITTNCLLCHGGNLGGKGVVIGQPEVSRDFTSPNALLSGLPGAAIDILKLVPSLTGDRNGEARELDRIGRFVKAQQGFPGPDTIGTNPADLGFGILASHRDPLTLAWKNQATVIPTPEQTVGAFVDVPAWWNLHRRNGMFYNGFGGGDHARIMMTASLLCVDSTQEAERIDAYFPDIHAYIMSLRAPKYTATTGLQINAASAAAGSVTYAARCVRCHGGKDGEGPEPLSFVSIGEVGTDPAYAKVLSETGGVVNKAFDDLFTFFNASWYGTHGAAGRLTKTRDPGYSPPPLDGIWATAPYLHNGSVPTLQALFTASKRPMIFKREFDPAKYDFGTQVGWPYKEVPSKGNDTSVYDAYRPGYSNEGHEFSAGLTDAEKTDLIEYLKTF